MSMAARSMPRHAIVLAAGYGKRMRPITETIPKPLVPVGGKPLIDWSLGLLTDTNVERAIVNVHWLGDKLIDYLADRDQPAIMISDERERILDSGGGVVKALAHLGSEPFYILNADTFWIDREASSLAIMADAWDDDVMDMLMLLVRPEDATGHSGSTDFLMSSDGTLARSNGAANGLIYAGALIANPDIFSGAKAEPHSLNEYFDRAIERKRLRGIVLDGEWITVGTPEAIAPAEEAIRKALALKK